MQLTILMIFKILTFKKNLFKLQYQIILYLLKISQMQNNQKAIQRIIQSYSKQNKKQLSLTLCKYWADLLLARDWSMLQRLDLQFCAITDDTFNIFLNLNWPYLTELNLRFNFLTSRGINLMLNCELKNIKILYLNNNLIGNKGVKYLIKMDFPKIQKIGIGLCQIGSEGIKHLTKARWPNLVHLKLFVQQNKNQNTMHLNGCEMIWQHQLQKLKQLCIPQNQLICEMNFVLLQGKDIKIFKSEPNMNQQMVKSIGEIFEIRKI